MAAAREILAAAYDDRSGAARATAAAGRRLVGIVGGAPVEPIIAAGALAVAITPDRTRATPVADHYIEPVVSPDIRALFEAAVAGEFADLDLLVISRANAKLYYYLKEIHRLGRAPKLPRLFMSDLMPSSREALAAYNRGRYAALVEAVERAVGRAVEPAAVIQAVALTNRVRGLQRRLQDRRWSGGVSGVEALRLIGAGAFLPPETYASALDEVLNARPAAPAPGPRVLIAGAEPFTQSHLHAAIEASGAVVVAEDDAWGARAGDSDIAADGDLDAAILAHAVQHAANPDTYPRQDRQAWFARNAVRPEVDVVVFHIPPSDASFGWDYPRLKALAEAAGKPAILLRQDAATAAAAQPIAAVFQAKLAELGSRAA